MELTTAADATQQNASRPADACFCILRHSLCLGNQRPADGLYRNNVFFASLSRMDCTLRALVFHTQAVKSDVSLCAFADLKFLGFGFAGNE